MKQLVGRRSAAVAGNGAAIEGEGRPTTGRFPLHLGLIAALVAGLLVGLPASPANGAPGSAGAARPDRSVPVTEVPSAATDEPRRPVDPPQPAVLPRRGSSVIDLPLAAGSGLRGTGSAVVGGLPVRVTPTLPPGADLAGSATARAATETAAAATPARVRVDVLDRAASAPLGAEVAVRLTRADGGTAGARVRVELDYSAFRGAYGADWARRLGLVRLPGCPAPGAAAAGCPGDQRLAATNDAKAGVISAEVEVPAASVPGGAAGSTRGDPVGGEANAPQSTGSVLVGLVATASSPETGDFTKTDLTEASSWSAGLQSGDFKWSYPIDVPPVPGELTPEVALSYSSAAVDGQTAGRHTQPSEIGEGWSYSPGFIERTYRPCADDSANSPYWTVLNTTPDMCWRLPNAQIMLNGKASEIVLGGDGTWRLEDGDGEKVQLVGEASQADAENEYWKITTTDGTQYWFGKQTLPNGRTGTNSVLTTEVFANHSSDPCFSTVSAKASRCPSQAVRWMLDYVVDPNGNEMSFWYGKTSNRTALVGDANSTGLYYREIHLNRIEYGTHTSDASTVPAPARVVFTYANRCLTSSCGTHDATNWPDTPWDLECLDTSCGNNKSPSYWTHLRLSQISTQVLAAGAYTVVDQWDLAHQFPATGDGSSPVLWLASITRTGKTAGGSISLPPVTFSGLRSQNRADYDPTAGMASHNKWRINKVVTESGHQIAVTYAATDTGCQFGSAFPDPDNNGKRCFPQIYKPTSGAAGWSWWHKRIVSDVVESDLTGASPNSIEHEYVYSLAATNAKVLWGHDNGARVWGASLSGRSWSDWRGYTNVIVRTGTPGIIRSQNEYVYFRGLEGDRTVAGTRDANITLYSGTWGDQLQRRGELANEIEYDVSGGVAQTVVQHNPWTVVTGTRTLSSAWATPGTFKSYINRIASTSRWERLDDGTMSYRTGVEDTFDAATGRLTSRYEKGNSAAGDETCTRYSYADNAAKHMYDFKIREQMVQGTCADPYTIPDDLVSDHAWRYDNGAYGAAPTLGNVTRDYVYKDTGWVDLQTNVGYDKYGRVISSDDGLLRRTLTTYTENSDRLTTTVQVTNPLGHVTKSSLNVARGLPLTVTDANLKTTTASYDALGRLATVTRPGNTTGLPDVDYAYAVSRSSPSYVRTRTLGPNGNQIASYDILDGMLRPRQTQTVAPDGKRVITDTQYNDRGLAEKTTTFYNADSGPSSALIAFNDADVDQQTRTVYDPQERVTDEELWSRDVFQWETKTSYGFNSTSVMPPTGGTVTKDVVDDRGNLVEKWQYRERSLAAAADVTRYGYNLRDELSSVTDPAGNTWTYEYNLLGWRTRTIDPDAGTSTATYDNAGQLTGTTDARGATLAYKYDALGRKVSTHQGSDTGTKLAEWTYDTIAKGQPATSTRHDGGLAYTSAVLSYDDAYRPTGSRLTVPASTANGALAGQYTTATSYKVSGAVATQTLPGVGGLPNETVSYSYTNQGLLSTMTGTWPGGGAQTYVAGTQYQFDGLVADQLLGATGKQVRLSNTFDAATRRLSKQQIDLADQVTSGAWVDKYTTEYGYDAAGNIRAAAGETDGVRDQVECFTYDYLRRLTEAWTNATWNCSAGPQRTGADAYWRQWTFDVVGDRRTQVDKDSAAGDTTWTYTVGAAGGVKPHQLSKVTATGPKAGPATRTFSYDAAGNTGTATAASGAAQTLTWNTEGDLASVVEAGATTSYLYDADGNRLITRTPTKTTLYLSDGTELDLPAGGGPVTGTRHYAGVGVRDATGVKWTAANQQGTSTVQIDSGTLATIRRRMLPYGEDRGGHPSGWVGTKGYVGGTKDNTGLTHLGAREYDPTLGRFISVDPIIDPTDPQQMHGYAYADNSPVTFSDPDGRLKCSNPRQCDSWSKPPSKASGHPSQRVKKKPKAKKRRGCENPRQCDHAAGEAKHKQQKRRGCENPRQCDHAAGEAKRKPQTTFWQVLSKGLKELGDWVDSGVTAIDERYMNRILTRAKVGWKEYKIMKEIYAETNSKVLARLLEEFRLANLPLVKIVGKSLPFVTFGLTYWNSQTEGDDAGTSFNKAVLSTVLGAEGAFLGGLCGPLSPVCVPAFSLAGSNLGEWTAGEISKDPYYWHEIFHGGPTT